MLNVSGRGGRHPTADDAKLAAFDAMLRMKG
jgi:hypothetical protein